MLMSAWETQSWMETGDLEKEDSMKKWALFMNKTLKSLHSTCVEIIENSIFLLTQQELIQQIS